MTYGSFLCRPCADRLCTDCRAIADEYAELLQKQKQAMLRLEEQSQRARLELDRATSRAADYERLMKLGQHRLLLAWMNSMTSAELLKAVEEEALKVRQP